VQEEVGHLRPDVLAGGVPASGEPQRDPQGAGDGLGQQFRWQVGPQPALPLPLPASAMIACCMALA
jgi:hypothetical protein